jgi:uncharacterized protein
MELIIGYLGAAMIGVTLGLIGGGGSILTVPLLVYCFHIEPGAATAYSLFIVGITSLLGGVASATRRLVNFKTAIVFSIPSFIAVYLTRRYLIPRIPDDIFCIGTFVVTKGIAMMTLFGLLMLTAGISMIVKIDDPKVGAHSRDCNYTMMIITGFVVGVLTGIAGMGGGFLIIPSLIFFARLPMKTAVGTSLMIIGVKSLVGFAGDVGSGQAMDFRFIGIISLIAIGGILFGTYVSRFIRGSKLKISFGWFVIAMSSWMLAKEIGVFS